MMLADLPDWAAALLDDEPVGHLGLLDGHGRPRVQPVTFARVGAVLVTAIDDKPKRGMPARVRRIRERPAVALTVDRYDDDWTRLAWVQVLGEAAIRDMTDAALAALTARYPVYRDMPPRGPLIEIAPTRLLWWRATTDPC
ncbi:MAG TPA: pyridoxamine 5'-phosphate oxidase family protein [Solirubrobacter sp.]|jgi:PPOX class probable F420-dependent enzyme|nr:pyridoxamine 5'-phosphate oxidase family protein [Solirubrobacter sp.]